MKRVFAIYTLFCITLVIIVIQTHIVTKPTFQNETSTEPVKKPAKILFTSSVDIHISNSPLLNTPTTSTSETKTILTQKNTSKPTTTTEIVKTENVSPIPEQTKTNPILSGRSNSLVRKAIVNILCSAKNQTLNSLSGSGVIIDPRGIILTNAHLAQYFLLTDYSAENPITCVIRTGSPAYPRYKAELVYISPSWIVKNASMLISSNPTGTGEQDYAFLRITEAIDKSPLPQFDFLVLETIEPTVNQPVVLAGYPASFLGSIAIERNLYLLSALSHVFDIFTFGQENTPDLISVGSSVLAQQGASGGAVASNNGTLLGIVVTTTEATSTATRDLRAITVNHIDRSFKKETGSTIEKLLDGDIAATAKNFEKNVAPLLKEQLLSVLKNP